MDQYAEMRAYRGCYEVMYVLRPYLMPIVRAVATGAGFAVVILLQRLVMRRSGMAL